LGALLTTFSSARAGVPDNPWVIPEPQGLEYTDLTFDDGTKYYLYSPTAKMFFASANDWNTRASICTFANPFWFTSVEECAGGQGRMAPEGYYFLNDDVANPARQMTNKDLFTDGGGSTWCDRDPGKADQVEFYWTAVKVGDSWRIQNKAYAEAGKFIGWKGDYNDTRLYMLAEGEGTIDWKVVTAESYENFLYGDTKEAYDAAVNSYIAALNLRTALVEADGLGVSINAASAVYTNTASTVDQLNAAKDLLNARIALKKSIDAAKAVYVDVAAAEAVLANEESTLTQVNNARTPLDELNTVKQALKALIDDCESKGYTETAAAKAVLQNTAATKAEVEAATKTLHDAYAEWAKGNATVENPADLTSLIVNPTFDNANLSGWSGDAWGRGGAVSDGAEHYNKNYNTYQKITNLAPGIYAVGVNGYYRAGDFGGTAEGHYMANDAASRNAKFYAQSGDEKSEVAIANVLSGAMPSSQTSGESAVKIKDADGNDITVYVPNTMAAGDYYMHTLNKYANKLYAVVGETGELTFGVQKTSQVTNDWSMFDDFSLTFYGNAGDAWQLYVNEKWGSFPPVTVAEDELVTQAYLVAYDEAQTADHSGITSKEDALQKLAIVQQAYDDVLKNIQLWKDYQTALAESRAISIDPYYQAPELMNLVGQLTDYYELDENPEGGPGMETILEEVALTNEQLEAEIAWLNKTVADIRQAAMDLMKPGADLTRFMKNPDFEECDVNTPTGVAPGWNVKKDVGNVTAGPLGQDNYNQMVSVLGKMNYCFESWHSHDFDVWQEVTGVPEGVVVIEAQGFVRCENTGYTRPNPVDPNSVPVMLYMNNATDVFPSVYSEVAADLGHELVDVEKDGDGKSWTREIINDVVYPNSMGGAAQCFDWGMYKMQTYGLVKAGETLRIGVRGKMKTDDTENWWCIWDNFKLTYQGYEMEYLKPALDQALSRINSDQLMGKSIKTKAKSLEAQAAEAVASNDGKTVFDMLAGIYDTVAEIEASVTLFKQLQAALEKLSIAMDNSAAAKATKDEAAELYVQIENGINANDYENEDVEPLVNAINVMIEKLAVPDTTGASDSKPIDMTSVIKSAAFESYDEFGNSASTAEGWKNPGNLGNDDTQKEVRAIEFWQIAFDMYQELKYLPAGTYGLQVDAWCRNGGNEENYAEWVADNSASMTNLYAVSGDSTRYAARVANVMKGALDYDYDPSHTGTFTPAGSEMTYYLPNDLHSGRNLFDDEGTYTTTIIVKVQEDGWLRVGLKKAEQRNSSWVVADNFKLWYYGAESTKEPNIENAVRDITTSEVVRTEYFTLDGRRANGQRGLLIQKQTLDNGTIVVRKVRK